MSITSLAENSGVSEATITRFCRLLGLGGYHELKLALAKSDRASKTSAVDDALSSVSESTALENLCRNLRDSYTTSINETIVQLDSAVASHCREYPDQCQAGLLFWTGRKHGHSQRSLGAFSTVTPKFIPSKTLICRLWLLPC